MSKHGKEPWNAVEVKRDEDELIQIRASNGAIIARLWIDVDDKQFSDEQRENASRIVACVNACRGLPTDELEQKGLVAAVGNQLLDLESLCDDLMVALEEIAGCDPYHHSSAGTIARAAIAKAKGGAA
ncbi:hypothetical protein CF126_08800 [Aeromonas dhakensis]|uniref:hypothetical protein n=1 Tax=Aeromonas dhakensis TaxID=196024 RepID=UPI001117EF6A|nr:hypothetical protein [Aeromonas dhakensis]TNI56543.1 hypothetical protein CF126_08800 [Aeromonas dhakensis]